MSLQARLQKIEEILRPDEVDPEWAMENGSHLKVKEKLVNIQFKDFYFLCPTPSLNL